MTLVFVDSKNRIYLIPIGEVNRKILEWLKEDLADVFGYRIDIIHSVDIPEESYSQERNQYYSSIILEKIKDLCKGLRGRNIKILGIIDVDLYVPSLNFVFGESDRDSGISVISITRLRQSYYGLPDNDNIFRLRVLKEAVHELGHTYGLGHCSNPKCVMYFSNSLLDTDRKDFRFCQKCQKILQSQRQP